MHEKSTFYKWTAIGALTALTMIFTHCGKPFSEKGDLVWQQSGVTVPLTGTSGSSSLSAFEVTMYPITRARCASCHSTAQQPLHASSNTQTAHNAVVNSYKVDFSNIPNSRMVRKLQEGHNCWGSCTANATEMSLAITEWKSLMERSGGGGGTTLPTGQLPEEVTVQTAPSRSLMEERNGATGAITIRFPLTTLGVANGSIEFRIEDYDQYSYRISQLRLTSPSRAVQIKGVYLLTNGKFNPQNANLTQVDETVPAGAGGRVLTPSSMIVLKENGNTDFFAIGFETLQ